MSADPYLESLGPLRARLRAIANRSEGRDYLALHEAANKLDDLQDLLVASLARREALKSVDEVLRRYEGDPEDDLAP